MCMNVSGFCLSTSMSLHTSCQHTRAHMQRPLEHPWDAVVTSVRLIRCRSPENHTYKHTYCVYVCVCVIYMLFVFFSEYNWQLSAELSVAPRYRGLQLDNNQLSALPPDIFAGLSSLVWVCVFLVAVYRVLCLSESFECVLSVCTYECIWQLFDLTSNACCTWIAPQHCIYKHQDTRTYMYRQTDRHSDLFFVCPFLWACTTVVSTYAHMQRSLGHLYNTLQLRWWRLWGWFALAPPTIIHTYMHTCVSVYLYIYIFICCLFAFMSIHDSCLLNSLFLLETGCLFCTTTSCRPCHPTFLPGFHRLGECACFSWLFIEYSAWVKVLNVCECVCVWVYTTAVWPNIKCLLHIDSTLSLYMQASGHTDVHVQTDRQTQWMD
jgi:hypothetical protein